MRFKFSALFIVIIFQACSKQSPELTQEELKFAGIVTEVYIANGLSNQITNGSKDSLRNSLTIQVLRKHDMDTTSFYNTLYKMEKNPMKVKILYDTVVSRLEKMRPL